MYSSSGSGNGGPRQFQRRGYVKIPFTGTSCNVVLSVSFDRGRTVTNEFPILYCNWLELVGHARNSLPCCHVLCGRDDLFTFCEVSKCITKLIAQADHWVSEKDAISPAFSHHFHWFLPQTLPTLAQS